MPGEENGEGAGVSREDLQVMMQVWHLWKEKEKEGKFSLLWESFSQANREFLRHKLPVGQIQHWNRIAWF